MNQTGEFGSIGDFAVVNGDEGITCFSAGFVEDPAGFSIGDFEIVELDAEQTAIATPPAATATREQELFAGEKMIKVGNAVSANGKHDG